jgi:hypothetical protein
VLKGPGADKKSGGEEEDDDDDDDDDNFGQERICSEARETCVTSSQQPN